MFIVIEGIDRSGKTTQCEHVTSILNNMNQPTTHIRFPDRTSSTGKLLSEYLSQTNKDRTEGSRTLSVDRAERTTELSWTIGPHIGAFGSDRTDKCSGTFSSDRTEGSRTLGVDQINTNDNTMAYTSHLLFSANRYESADKIRSLLKQGHVICDRYSYSGIAYSMAQGVPMEWCINTEQYLPAPDLVIYLHVPVSVTQTRSGFGQERYEVVEMQNKVYEAYNQLRNSWDIVPWKIIDGTLPRETVTELIISLITNTMDNYKDDLVENNK